MEFSRSTENPRRTTANQKGVRSTDAESSTSWLHYLCGLRQRLAWMQALYTVRTEQPFFVRLYKLSVNSIAQFKSCCNQEDVEMQFTLRIFKIFQVEECISSAWTLRMGRKTNSSSSEIWKTSSGLRADSAACLPTDRHIAITCYQLQKADEPGSMLVAGRGWKSKRADVPELRLLTVPTKGCEISTHK